MKKNRILNYKFCFTTFWKVLALYDHFWVTYAKNLNKTEISSFSQNFDRELINYSGMSTDTDMRFFAKDPQCKKLSRSIKSDKIKKNKWKIEISTFFKTDLTKNWKKIDATMKKNRF